MLISYLGHKQVKSVVDLEEAVSLVVVAADAVDKARSSILMMSNWCNRTDCDLHHCCCCCFYLVSHYCMYGTNKGRMLANRVSSSSSSSRISIKLDVTHRESCPSHLAF